MDTSLLINEGRDLRRSLDGSDLFIGAHDGKGRRLKKKSRRRRKSRKRTRKKKTRRRRKSRKRKKGRRKRKREKRPRKRKRKKRRRVHGRFRSARQCKFKILKYKTGVV